MLMGPSPIAVNTSELIANTAGHEKQINLMEAEFLNVIAKDPKVAPLAKKMPDPEEPSKEVYQFYVECQAPKSQAKHDLLNCCLLIFSMTHVKSIYRDKKDL